MSDLAKQVLKTFPENGRFQLVCLRMAVTFQCAHCKAVKRDKLLAVVDGDWEQLLCKGCYEEQLSQPDPQ